MEIPIEVTLVSKDHSFERAAREITDAGNNGSTEALNKLDRAPPPPPLLRAGRAE